MHPTQKSPDRAIALQQYLLLHSQREALEAAPSHVSGLPPTVALNPRAVSRLPQRQDHEHTFHVPATVSNNTRTENIECNTALNDLNNEIKCTLTNLLNCEGVKTDERYRTWVQSRLMDTEKKLLGNRKHGHKGKDIVAIS